jgi:hypothetical protein
MQKLDNSYKLEKEEVRTMTIKDFRAGDYIYINKWLIQIDLVSGGMYFYQIIGKWNRHYQKWSQYLPKYIKSFLEVL